MELRGQRIMTIPPDSPRGMHTPLGPPAIAGPSYGTPCRARPARSISLGTTTYRPLTHSS